MRNIASENAQEIVHIVCTIQCKTMLQKEQVIMTYSFVCPLPCNHIIQVDAENDHDAALELIAAGALRCRNAEYQCFCEKAPNDILPMSEEQIKQIVRTCMREEQDRQSLSQGILAPLYR
jgi:hypothetical protein